jgi:uracil-DNA glycosylase
MWYRNFMSTAIDRLHEKITQCNRCPRLRSYCTQIGTVKKREFREWNYWAKPVPSFGSPEARIWIVGLAPAAHGANRTGRMFTGDSSGKWLYKALYSAGFSNQIESFNRTDSLSLKETYISAAAHCAPPDNKPLPEELAACSSYLDEEYRLLKKVELILCLGKISFDSILSLFARQGMELPKPKPKFSHGTTYKIGAKTLLTSYHPSRQNTQTGRLTEKMWNAIFEQAKNSLN